MSRILMFAGALVLTGAAHPAAAQDAAPAAPTPEMAAPPPSSGPSHRMTGAAVLFNMLDEDRSGTIGLDEASVLFESIFVTIDANEDGELSKDEINIALQRFYGHGGRGKARDGYRSGRRDEGRRGEGRYHHGDGR